MIKEILGFFVVIVAFLLCGVSQLFEIQKIITLGLVPILGLLCFGVDPNSFTKVDRPLFIYLLIFISSVVSFSAAVDTQVALSEVQMILGSLLCAYIAVIIIKIGVSEDYFFYGFILAIFFHAMYLSLNYNGIAITAIDRNALSLNANKYSYYLYFGFIGAVFLYLKYKNKLSFSILIGCSFLYLYVPLITASRSGMIMGVIMNIIFWYWVYRSNAKSYWRILKYVVPTILLFGIGIYIYVNYYLNSFLAYRMQVALNEGGGERVNLLFDSFRVFLENPILGAGPGQYLLLSRYGHFSHTSITEALANQGIIGGILVILLLLQPIFFLKFYKKSIQFYRLIIFFVGSFCIMNFIYPFYKFPFSILFLFAFLGALKKYRFAP